MNEEDKIGKKIKERLEGHEFPVSGELWEHISKNLPPEIASKPIDIAAKNVVGSAVNTSFIASLTLLGIAAIVAIGLYLASNSGKQTRTASPVPAKQFQANTQQPAGTEQPLTNSVNKLKNSNKNDVKTSISVVASDTNTLLKSTADKDRNGVEDKTIPKELVVENNTIHVQPKVSHRDSVVSTNDKKLEIKNQPTTIWQHANRRTKTGSIIKGHSYGSVNRKDQTSYEAKDKLELYTDPQGREQSINHKNENIEKLKSTLLSSHPKENQEQEESGNLNPDQSNVVGKPTAMRTAGIHRIENYKNLQSNKEVADQLLTTYASNAKQIRFLDEQFIKANRQAKADITELENKIIPTKNKSVITFSDLSLDALINTQYAFTTAKGDFNNQDSTTQLQARKAIVSGGIRINYNFPSKRSFFAESKITLSSGVLLEKVQNGYTYTYKHTTLDSTYRPVYKWHYSGSGDSIRVIVDTVLSTNINKQIRSFTQQQKVTYLGVPLTFSYNWHKNKWSFYITAGAQMNILLNNKTTVTSGDTLQNMPSLEVQQIAYRRVVPLVIANAGIRYKITDKLSFIIEPSFKYGLRSIYKGHNALQQRLSILGINTGIRYKF